MSTRVGPECSSSAGPGISMKYEVRLQIIVRVYFRSVVWCGPASVNVNYQQRLGVKSSNA